MFSLKKSLAIAKENIIFSKNELIIMASTILFIISAYLFWSNLWLDYKEASYVSTVWFVYVILLNITWAYFAIASINKDIEGKYIYFLLKNCSRTEYIFWKALSITWVIFITNLIFGLIFMTFYAFLIGDVNWFISYIIPFQFLESWVFAMIAILVTLLIKNNIARIFALIIVYFLGNATYGIRVLLDQQAMTFWKVADEMFQWLYIFVPNFSQFNIRDVLPYTTDLWFPLLSAVWYAIILVIILFFISKEVFKKNNL